MKSTLLKAMVAALAFAVPALGLAQSAVDSEHKFELAKKYYGDCAATDSSEFDDLRPHLKKFAYNRGLVEYVEVSAETIVQWGAEIFARLDWTQGRSMILPPSGASSSRAHFNVPWSSDIK